MRIEALGDVGDDASECGVFGFRVRRLIEL